MLLNDIMGSEKKIDFNLLKENIGMIVLIPTLLGGLWQLLELTSLGVPYVRFFSLSQLVSDGLLILFILAFTMLPVWFVFKDADLPRIRIRDTEETDGEVQIPRKRWIYFDGKKTWVSKKNGYYFLSTFTIIYAAIVILAFWPEIIIPLMRQTKTSVFGLLGIMFMVSLTLIYLRILFKTIFEIHTLKVNYDNKSVREIRALFWMFLFFGFIIFCIYITRLFHHSFLFPENFKNQQYITCRIQRNNPKLKKFNIDYFNDKYVFVTITNEKNEKHLEIFNFEDFLDQASCIEDKL